MWYFIFHFFFSLFSGKKLSQVSEEEEEEDEEEMAESTGGKSIDITKSPEDIPKADLIHLCLKMKKRMEQLTSKETESTKRRRYLLNQSINRLFT